MTLAKPLSLSEPQFPLLNDDEAILIYLTESLKRSNSSWHLPSACYGSGMVFCALVYFFITSFFIAKATGPGRPDNLPELTALMNGGAQTPAQASRS